MRRVIGNLFSLLLLWNTTTALSDHHEDPWKDLFDGKSLEGWIQRNGWATFKVDKGTILGITAQGSPNSFLTTKRNYRDFTLTFDVKVDEALNSGVQIRSKSTEAFKNGRVHGPQVEIASNGNAGYVFNEGLGGWLHHQKNDPKVKSAFHHGEWNTYKIRVKGSHIQTWINETRIADFQETQTGFEEGFIGLQVHGIGKRKGPFEVRWRNIKIREDH